MNIGIVMHPYSEEKPSGLGTSVFDLSRALIEENPQHTYTLFLKGKHRHRPDFDAANYTVVELGTGPFWLEGLREYRTLDLVLFPMPFLPYFFVPKNAVVIVRDFGYKHISASNIKIWIQNKLLHFINARAFARAKKIVAISQATKAEAIATFSISPEKVEVVYNGHRGFGSMEEEEVDISPNPFFFTVGVVKERKNILRAIDAFALFKKTDTEGYKYYFVGKKGGVYYDRVRESIVAHGLEDEVIFLDYLSDGQISFLYRRARAVVYVSLLEGFGKPALEAMDCAAPLITSDEPPLNEVVGDDALLVDPRDTAAIADAMRRIATDKELCLSLVERGKRRAGNFSWPKSAAAYQSLFNTLR